MSGGFEEKKENVGVGAQRLVFVLNSPLILTVGLRSSCALRFVVDAHHLFS